MDKILRLRSRRGIDKRGVTLIEILVTLVIAGIAMAAIYEIYLSIQRHGIAQDAISEMQQNVRIATDQITKELRSAGYNPNPIVGIVGSGCAAPDSPSCSTRTLSASYPGNSVTLRGDFDGDGVFEEATYKVNTSSALVRCYKVSTDPNPCQDEVFVPNITSVTFNFYDKTNTATDVKTVTTTPPDSTVRRVAVSIKGVTKQYDKDAPVGKLWTASPCADVDPNKRCKTASLTSDAVLRNFGATAADTTAPTCPTNIAVTVTNNCGELQVTWSWADSTPPAGDLAGFLIYYQASNGLDTGTLTVQNPSARSAFLQKRQTGISYSVDVRAYDRYFNKNTTCDPLPYPTATPENVGAPSAPTGFQAAPGNNQVTLTWNPIDTSIPTNRDAKGYRLYRGTAPDFVPGTTNMIACERTKSGDPIPTGCPSGKNLLSTPDAETGWSSVTSFTDATALNCTKYYYIIRAVDQCLLEGPNSTVINATPPDNDKKPNTPVITSLVAGDDISTIIVSWTLAYDQADTTHSAPDIFRVFKRLTGPPTGPWEQWGADIPITLTGGVQTLTGSATLTPLLQNTYYDVKVSAFDSAAMCRNESPSTPGTITTAACGPLITWGNRGGHFISPGIPGITPTGSPLANFSKVGTEPDTVANSRYITWKVDPLDCTDTSNNYDRNGFDYDNPPLYTPGNVKPLPNTPKVEFYINVGGSSTNTPAHDIYKDSIITFPTNVDLAARSDDGYYHWPVYPYQSGHIDTTKFCDGQKDFKIRAVDGETYSAENTIILEIKNGGIVHNSSQATITNITTPDDFHNQVIFSLRNSSTVKDLRITKMKPSWNNTLVNLKKIEVFDINNILIGLFEDTVLPIDTISGTEVTLTQIPNIPVGSTATVKVTFTKDDGTVPSTADMRGKTVTLDSVSVQDNADPLFFNCTATALASLATSSAPIIGPVVQDQPSPNTPAKTSPDPSIKVAANTPVKVSLPTAPIPPALTSTRIRYGVDTLGSSTAPPRPSSLAGSSLFYANLVTMVFDSITGLWNGTIPANNNARIWYFIEAVEVTANFDISPEQGAYTYAQCGITPPTVSPISSNPVGPNVNGNVDVEVTASSVSGIQTVILFADPSCVGCSLGVPPTPMGETLPGSGVWRGSYNAGAGSDHHILQVKVTDNCGNVTTVSKSFN